MEFRVLGPVKVLVDGSELPLGRRRERLLLGLLLLENGRTVPIEQLEDAVWDGNPPRSARSGLGVAVSRLRSSLKTVADGAITSQRYGYRIDVDAVSIDAYRFRVEVDQALSTPDHRSRINILSRALNRWRGPLLADVVGAQLQIAGGTRLEQLRLDAQAARFEAVLAVDDVRRVIPDLVDVVAAHPDHEQFVVLLMRAYFETGQFADAIRAYHRLAGRLADALGVDPGPAARDLLEHVLRADNASSAIAPDVLAAGPAFGGRPHALPPGVRGFTGRDRELAYLDSVISDAAGTSPVAVISGMGGIGKTALVVRWAHSVADRYPDGQLYVNLRGYDMRDPCSPLHALIALLSALGVPADRIPADEDRAAGMYRSILADKRVLVVLDNAQNVGQVRPLLAAGRHNAVIITSRDSLAGLVARDGAKLLHLPVLTSEESARLLGDLLPASDANTPELHAELAQLCGYLPLALRIVIAQIATRPAGSVPDVVAALRTSNRLPALAIANDPDCTLATIFHHSYATLGTVEQRLFRLLGAGPCHTFTSDSAAAVGDTTCADAEEALKRLSEAHMIIFVGDGRYGFHDLLREYATTRADRDDDAAAVRASGDRLIDWYRTWVTEVASALATDGRHAETAIVDAEIPNLFAIIDHAAAVSRFDAAWAIPSALFRYLDSGRHVAAAIEFAQRALAAAQQLGDRDAERRSLTVLGMFCNNAHRPADALVHLQRAVAIARTQGARQAEARARNNIGVAYKKLGRSEAALDIYLDVLNMWAIVGDQDATMCATLNNVGNLYAILGRFEAAHTYLERAVSLAVTLDNRSRAMSLANLGWLYIRQGRFGGALPHLLAAHGLTDGIARFDIDCKVSIGRAYTGLGEHTKALGFLAAAHRISRDAGDAHREGIVLVALADTHMANGDRTKAIAWLTAAEAIRAVIPDHTETEYIGRLKAQLVSRDAAADSSR